MSAAETVIDWLQDEGARILIIILTGTSFWIFWHCICIVLIKALKVSGVKAREAVLRSQMQLTKGYRQYQRENIPVVSVEEDEDEDFDENDENKDEELGSVTSSIETKINPQTSQLLNDYSPLDGIGGSTHETTINKKSKKTKKNKSHKNDDSTFDDIQFDISDEVKRGVKYRAKKIGGVIRNTGNFAIFAVVLVQILDTIGVPTTSLLTTAALIGFAIALAAQTVIADFVSGLFILSENQYFQGEIVTINDTTGIVERLSLRLTTLRSFDGILHTIPNGTVRCVANRSRDYSMVTIMITLPFLSENEFLTTKECLNNIIPQSLKMDKTLDINYFYDDPSVNLIESFTQSTIKIHYTMKVRAGYAKEIQQAMIKYIRIQFPKNHIQFDKIETPSWSCWK